MYIGNNWLVCGTFYSGVPVNEYFIDEKSAREYANRLYSMDKTKSIELLKRQRVGYVKVKKLLGTMRVRVFGLRSKTNKYFRKINQTRRK